LPIAKIATSIVQVFLIDQLLSLPVSTSLLLTMSFSSCVTSFINQGMKDSSTSESKKRPKLTSSLQDSIKIVWTLFDGVQEEAFVLESFQHRREQICDVPLHQHRRRYPLLHLLLQPVPLLELLHPALLLQRQSLLPLLDPLRFGGFRRPDLQEPPLLLPQRRQLLLFEHLDQRLLYRLSDQYLQDRLDFHVEIEELEAVLAKLPKGINSGTHISGVDLRLRVHSHFGRDIVGGDGSLEEQFRLGADIRRRGVVEDLFQVELRLDGLMFPAGHRGRRPQTQLRGSDLLVFGFSSGQGASPRLGRASRRRLAVTLTKESQVYPEVVFITCVSNGSAKLVGIFLKL
jgi:hypothetical protein